MSKATILIIILLVAAISVIIYFYAKDQEAKRQVQLQQAQLEGIAAIDIPKGGGLVKGLTGFLGALSTPLDIISKLTVKKKK